LTNLAIFFGDDSIKEKYSSAYKKYRKWTFGHVGSRCVLCKGLSMPAGNGFDSYLIHADKNYPYKRSSSDFHQTILPIFSLVEAEIYDSQSKTLYTTVVRILAILRFRSPIFDDIKKKEAPRSYSYDDDIVCVIAPLEIDSNPQYDHSHLLPFDLYQYQKDPHAIDNRMLHIKCCHISALKRPVFYMGRNKMRMDNYVNNMEFGKTNKRRQQFFVITIERWHPKVKDGRAYDTFYSNRTTTMKSSGANKRKRCWSAFSSESELTEVIDDSS
jgi:hypothetical protein